MPKKRYEEMPYDPIGADLAREVAATGRKPQVVVVHGPQKEESHSENGPTESKGSPRKLPRNIEALVTKRFQLTRKEDDDLNAFLLRLQARAGTKVTFSVVVRAALNVLMVAEEEILREIGERFPVDCPSTHDSIGMGEFEERWVKCLRRGVRKIPLPKLGLDTSFIES